MDLISILFDIFLLIGYYVLCKLYFIYFIQFVFVLCNMTQRSSNNASISVKQQYKILRHHFILHNCTHTAGKQCQKIKLRNLLYHAFLFPNTCHFSKTNEVVRSVIIMCVYVFEFTVTHYAILQWCQLSVIGNQLRQKPLPLRSSK